MQKIIKGDTVKLMLGKDNGKTGQVLRILNKDGKVYVEGANMSKRHVKKTAQNEGGIIELIKPVNLSNVMLVCPNCEKTVRVGIEVVAGAVAGAKDGKKIRICKKCKKQINTKKESK